MEKYRVVVYDCYAPLNTETKKSHYTHVNQVEDKFIQDECYSVVGSIYDNCSPTTALSERKEFVKLKQMIECGEVDIIAVFSLKYLSQNLSDMLEFVDWIRKRNIILIGIQEDFNSLSFAATTKLHELHNLPVPSDANALE